MANKIEVIQHSVGENKAVLNEDAVKQIFDKIKGKQEAAKHFKEDYNKFKAAYQEIVEQLNSRGYKFNMMQSSIERLNGAPNSLFTAQPESFEDLRNRLLGDLNLQALGTKPSLETNLVVTKAPPPPPAPTGSATVIPKGITQGGSAPSVNSAYTALNGAKNRAMNE